MYVTHPVKRAARLAGCVAFLLLWTGVKSVAAYTIPAAASYQFTPGQELVYEGTKQDWFGKNDPADLAISWRLWVLDVDKQGCGDLLIEYCAKRGAEVEERYLFRVAVECDGRTHWNPTLAALPAWLSPRQIVPQLPTDEETQNGAWRCVEPRSGMRWEYRRNEGTDDSRLDFVATCQGPLEDVSVGSLQFDFEFDKAAGHLVRFHSQGEWKDYNEHNEETLALTNAATHDAAFTRTLRADVERLFSTVEECRQLVGRHDMAKLVRPSSEGTLTERFAKAKASLVAAQAANQSPQLDEHYQGQLQAQERRAGYLLGENATNSRLQSVAKAIDQPSPEWTAEDLQKSSHALADYRGKVVVLDFWFRKCNYCIRAQPQFEAVINRFKDKPVAFLGVNIDENPADADFAVAQLKTTYPTLRGIEIQKLYPASGAPTWIVIDPAGIVRAVHVGYSGFLEEELTETIEKLLKVPG
ncbi:MAG TPA: TlpA disulfide reductase family protein [Pirellulales bacterium]|jgi:thiol-disulfide isomerase/thioredoxin